MTLQERFIRYVKIATPASYDSATVPSTMEQLEFLKMLANELKIIGLSEIEISNNAVLFAEITASKGREGELPIGLIAHVDTSPDAPSDNITPIIHSNYDGGKIVLPNGILSPEKYPELLDFIGHTIISSDGRTLLGADDKAGVAILISLADYLLKNPQIQHPKIRLAFTTDEEIGKSIDNFDVEKFGVKYAYTLDSGGYGLLEYENFNAASATFTITGKNIHPGYAYHKMINACDVAFEIHSQIPTDQRPVSTQDREGFYHLHDMSGGVENATLHYIVRDFDDQNFASRKEFLRSLTHKFNELYPDAIELNISDSYYNMRSFIPYTVIDRAREAYKRVGVLPIEHPIRGGTDGARLSKLGVPTPNMFNGGMNFHSKDEYCSLEVMQKALDMTIELVSATKS